MPQTPIERYRDLMTEEELLQAVRTAARYHGWLSYHTYRSTKSEPGFPDLVLVRGPHVLWVELKAAQGHMTPAQERWARSLLEAAQHYYQIRPHHWREGLVERILTEGPAAARPTPAPPLQEV